jgi:hypothetical protein
MIDQNKFWCAAFLMACGVNGGLGIAALINGWGLATVVFGALSGFALRMAYEYGVLK